ncbi:MAG TPA: LysR family transcriptional regulator [Steroidobacter sp.]|uniref:LysR family transcriptional regulator n=1 Tax=Steroidobacter sp. TaxID=1978227 RepID=UPI002ED92EE0
MDIRQFRHIAALAEHKHFGRAAEAIGITQAALTQSIQKIEEAYGVLLFERRPGDVTPTAYGEVVVETARATISKVTHMRRQIRLMQKLAAGRLIIGCDPYFAEPIVAPALIRLLRDYPHLEFTLELGGWEALQARLLAREVDVYIGFPYDAMDTHIVTEDYELPPFIIFGRSGHSLMQSQRVTPRECFRFPLVVPKASLWLRKRVERIIRDPSGAQVRLPAYLLTTDFGIIRQVVRNSDALAAAAPRSIKSELEQGVFSRVALPEFEFPISLVIATVALHNLAPAADALLTEIRKEIATMG